MATIHEYVLLLAKDPDEADRFRASIHSARSTMSGFGLSKKEQDVLLSGNAEEISQAIQGEFNIVDRPRPNTQCMVKIAIPPAPTS